MSEHTKEFEEALRNCSRDPIHIPGAIQSFGVLIAADRRFQNIQQVSANVSSLFDIKPEDALERSVDTFFDEEARHLIRNCLGHATIDAQRVILPVMRFGGVDQQISLHRRGSYSIVEIMPEVTPPDRRFIPINLAREFLSDYLDLRHEDQFWQNAVELIRSMVGHDRVKFYRFLPDLSGEVVAESRHPDVPSFLGLRFPESDIPKIARELYAKTPIRVLSDVSGEDVPILALPEAETLDMSLAILRGKDAVHQKYLQNMGVNATLTIPVVVDGKLWGLFASHHREPKIPDPSVLAAAELAGKLISLRLQHAIEHRKQDRYIACGGLANRLVVLDDSELGMGAAWEQVNKDISDLIPSDGVALFVNGVMFATGTVPTDKVSSVLIAVTDPNSASVTSINDLRSRFPGAAWGKSAGALVITIPGETDLRVVYFRNASNTKVTWAGAPEKNITQSSAGPRLDPRNSFDQYLEEVEDKADDWTASDLEVANALLKALSTALTTQEQLRENRHRMGLMVRELNHRVRNILALVQSLSRHSREDAKSISAYAEALEERILALAGAHNLLTGANMKGAKLRDLVMLEIRPFQRRNQTAGVSGPDLVMRPDAASVLALLFHELTSNAAKYGALKDPGGAVEVSWKIENDGVRLNWIETGGPKVTEPSRNGFGRSIIEGAIPYEFKGDAKLEFRPEGVFASFWLPGETITSASRLEGTTEPSEFATTLQNARPSNGRKKRVALVVEDNFVVALSAKRMLLEAGFEAVEAASSIEEALSAIDGHEIDFCLLDVNLQGVFSTPVALELQKKDIPFVFATGYGSQSSEIIAAFDVPVIAKPIDEEDVRTVLKSMFTDSG